MTIYNLVKCLGKGSYGSVYQVRNNNKVYAMKRISTYNMREKDKRNLLNEMRILRYCNCPYILKCVDVVANFTNIDIITHLIRYGDFLTIIKNRKNLRFEEQLIWSYFIQVSLGLEYLHNNNIIHRDIKCGNIFLDRGDQVVIGDLGSSKIIKQQQRLNCTGGVGTPYYMCPQVMTRQEYSKDADVWGLGCYLFEIITFNPPFKGYSFHKLSQNIQNQKFSVSIESYSIYYGKELLKLVGKILKKYNRLDMSEILNLKEVEEKKYLIPYIEGKSRDIEDFEDKFKDLVFYNWYDVVRKMKMKDKSIKPKLEKYIIPKIKKKFYY